LVELDAHQRELLRLAEVKARRTARDEQRRLAQLREADEAQRRPLLLRLALVLGRYRQAQATLEAHLGEQAAIDARWRELELTREAVDTWRSAGFEDASAVGRVLRPLESCAAVTVPTAGLLPSTVIGLVPDALDDLDSKTGCLWASALLDAGLITASGLLEDRLASFWLAESGVAVPLLHRGEAGTPWSDWLLLHQVLAGTARIDQGDLERGDLRILDELADRAPRTVGACAGAAPESGPAAYLLARSQPERLSDEQVESLGWTQELERRQLVLTPSEPPNDPYLAACRRLLTGNGSSSDLDVVSEFHRSALLGDLRQFRGISSLMVSDPSCWSYVESQFWLDKENSIASLGSDPLGVWLALRRVRALLYQRQLQMVLTEITHALRICHQHKQAQIELETARGLAQGLLGQSKQAQAALRRVTKLTESVLPQQNLEAGESAQDPTRLSPFALLGVDFGHSDWEEAYDERYNQTWRTDTDLTIELNWAYDELSSGAEGRWVTFPLRPALYAPVPTNYGVFRPVPRPLPRATPAVDDAFRERLRHLAWLELKTELMHALTPARTL
jgi:hypothetical protein